MCISIYPHVLNVTFYSALYTNWPRCGVTSVRNGTRNRNTTLGHYCSDRIPPLPRFIHCFLVFPSLHVVPAALCAVPSYCTFLTFLLLELQYIKTIVLAVRLLCGVLTVLASMITAIYSKASARLLRPSTSPTRIFMLSRHTHGISLPL